MTIGVGPTETLSLRVSVATLSRVVFNHPQAGIPMLALEHKAHSTSSGDPADIFLQAQPFGGGARLLPADNWRAKLGAFHFDSQRSRAESDFRIFIKPDKWETILQLVTEEAALANSELLDSDPARELAEEFDDTLGYNLAAEQYTVRRTGFAIEHEPVPTHSWRAPGQPTVRVYCLDQVTITDVGLIQEMLAASQRQTSKALLELARQRAETTGHGRANGMFIAPLEEIKQALLSIEPAARDRPLPFGDTTLSSNLVALLPEVGSMKYEYMGLEQGN